MPTGAKWALNRRRWILQNERAVELRREVHLDEILIWLLYRDDEPQNDGQEQRRALESEPLGKRAVVAQNEQAGGIGVEPSDRIDPPGRPPGYVNSPRWQARPSTR